ncbi:MULTISPECIES: DUF3710 domain-containing protein [Protofrankia]|uniref:DUF3710 domain-containing protein n=1 Tax=Protofrankia coriariae TaxID=1562887 RepID=A0ABR5F515_9ACTN|nr:MULTISPECIES: DUF3710 domain-containing protein [Protofrankia]KLL11819.1 hypothetical protein FrCorBMG51_08930 [Protofrankia coriariae]ONH36894.1 hypothetical protein BL254_05580 [Protofrankia sp. BMG5.30]
MFRRGRRRAGRGWQDPQEYRDDRDETGYDSVAVDHDGPYDADEAPDDHVRRLDLGSLRIPMIDGVQVQFQVDQASGQLLTVTLTDGQSGMELSAFAAAKSAGLWDEVRAEIVDSLRAAAGTAEETDGFYGRELRLQLPTGTPGELVPGRMVGIDGPRWFLRVVFTGYAALDPTAAPPLVEALRRLVVVRGDQAMPLRDPLPLKLPREITDPHGSDGQSGPSEPGPDPREVVGGVATTTGRMPTPGVRIAEVG